MNHPAVGMLSLILVVIFFGPGCGRKLTLMEAAESGGTNALVFWNKLDSSTGIAASEIGSGGTYLTGTFGTGIFGNAYVALPGVTGGVLFPADVFPTNGRGTLEFWAKMTNVPNLISNGFSPEFFHADDGVVRYSLGFHSNSQDTNQLTGVAGNGHRAKGPSDAYSNLLGGAGSQSNWHHYALVWDRDGLGTPSQKTALYVDGVQHAAFWSPGNDAFPRPSASLVLIPSNGAASMTIFLDNLKIYNFAKSDFSGRFNE